MKILKISTLFVLALLLASCSARKILPSTKPLVSLELDEVNGAKAAGLNYTDDIITIAWSYVTGSELNFKLKNNSDKEIKVLWDNGKYVDADGSSNSIIHNGVKLGNKYESQHPTIVPSSTEIADVVIPVNKIEQHKRGLFEFSDKAKKRKKQLENNYGKTVKVVLPIEHNSKIIDYTYSFVVKEYKKPRTITITGTLPQMK